MTDEPTDKAQEAAAFLQTSEGDAVSPERQAAVEALGEKIIDALRTVYDPEIPVNIYELGLIYKIDVDDDDKVHIDMTLTSPMCPVAETLPPEVETKVAAVAGVEGCTVAVVWDPPWHPSMMTEEAQLELGLIY
ncbi:MAG: SUF system Fe-S cluster assembly protein [Pseudomonadota bacterium]